MYVKGKMGKLKGACALALAAVLLFGLSFTPLAGHRAQEEAFVAGGEAEGLTVDMDTDAVPDDGGEQEEERHEEQPPAGEEPDAELEGDGQAPEGTETPGGEAAGNDGQQPDGPKEDIKEDIEEQGEPPVYEYDDQPASAQEALEMWEAAADQGLRVKWEHEPEAELIPEGYRAVFILWDDEGEDGYWTLAMDIRAMAATQKTVTSGAAIQAAINAAKVGDVLTLVVPASFEMTETITIDKDITLNLVAAQPVVLRMTSNYVRHFTITAGNVTLAFENIEMNGLVTENTRGGGFDIKAGASLLLRGANVTDTGVGPERVGGGALLVEGYLEILDSTFRRADAFYDGGIAYVAAGGVLKITGTDDAWVTMVSGNATSSGGAIYVANGGRLEADHLRITADVPSPSGNGSQVGGRVGLGMGGGIYWDISPEVQGRQALTNSVIADSFASVYGSGLYINVRQGATLHAFENNLIENNTLTGNLNGMRGTVLLANEGKVESFKNNTFSNNYAADAAGLYVRGTSPVTIEDTRILNNKGEVSTNYAAEHEVCNGAGLYSDNALLTLVGGGTHIEGNVGEDPTGNGGGIYVASGKTVFEAGTISGNSTQGSGGGVYVASGASYVHKGGTISGNTAAYGGGIYVVAGGAASVQGGTVDGNKTTAGGGLGIFSFGDLTIAGGTISGHEAEGRNGAAVMVGTGSTAVMSGGTITGNTLTNQAGRVGVGNGAAVYVNEAASFTMSGGMIEGNTTAVDGAAIYSASGNTIEITGGTISGNRAGRQGGAIYLDEANTLTVSAKAAIAISGNTAQQGGAVYSRHDDNSVLLEESGAALVLDGNGATNHGGAVYMERGDLRIAGGSFTNNTAGGAGGALYLLGSTVTASITGGRIGIDGKGNTAAGDGGGIFNSAGTLTISGTASVSGNTADGNGGGIGTSYGNNQFEGTKNGGPLVSGNTAAGNGGGIYASNGTLGMDYVTVAGNKAQDGGGLYVAVGGLGFREAANGGEEIRALDNNTFRNNEAVGSGGGLYVYISANGVSKSISGNTIEENEAGGNGGGVYIAYYGVGQRVSDNLVQGNTAGANGGGAYVAGTMQRYFALTNDKVLDNVAGENGGGLYVNNTVLRVYDAAEHDIYGVPEISGNRAKNGGGIYAAGYGKVVVEHGEIVENHASVNGGGIYSNVYLADKDSLGDLTQGYADILVEVGKATLRDNTAAVNGAGIYVGQRGGLTLRGTALEKNIAAQNGGGVYIATFGILDIDAAKDGTKTVLDGNIATAGDGGGLYVGNGTLALQNARIINNRADAGNGGGVYLMLLKNESGSGAAQVMARNRFEGNHAVNGGAMHITIKEGATSDVIAENEVVGNSASGDGGGIWINYSGEGKSVYGNLVEDNAARRGGGMYITGTPQKGNNMALSNDRVIGNRAEELGGGILVENSAFVLFDAEAVNSVKSGSYKTLDGDDVTGHALIYGNTAANDDDPAAATAGNGGGIYLLGSTLLVQNGRIEGNKAAFNGGGINADTNSLVEMYRTNIPVQFVLEVLDNTSAQGHGGGMYLSPYVKHELEGLLMQGNTALSGDGGGIYVAKSLLKNLYITDSSFGTPDPADPEADTFNAARNGSYVEWLNDILEADYIGYHKTNLARIGGHSPDETGAVWAELEGAELYYNNFDIAFHTVWPVSAATVTYHANGGYFADLGGVKEHAVDAIVGASVLAPRKVEHNRATFIGWYDTALDAQAIIDGDREQNVGLITDATPPLWYYKMPNPAADKDFYAAWLPPPTVEAVYDDAEKIKVEALDGVADVSLMVADTLVTGGSKTDSTTWEFDVSHMDLEAGMELKATQTIELYGETIESPEAVNLVLPTYHVLYHAVPEGEANQSYDEPEVEWLPKDEKHYHSSADAPVTAEVQPPVGGDPVLDGYRFIGWQPSGTGTLLTGGKDTVKVYDEDVHLYAAFASLYDLTYDANIGGGTDLDSLLPAATMDAAADTVVSIGTWGSDIDTLRPGYRFLYWTEDREGNGTPRYLDAGTAGTGAYTTEVTLNRNIVLYAQWLPLYEVKYDLNYDDAPVGTIVDDGEYAIGERFTVVEDEPGREGYTFIGWNYYQHPAQSADKWYEGGREYTMDKPGILLYAQWKRNLTISYDGNGHTGGTVPARVTGHGYKAPYTVEAAGDLEKEGHSFEGWALNDPDAAEVFGAGDTYIPETDTVFYALWEPLVPLQPVILKEADRANVKPGDSFTYTITVKNEGPLAVDAVVTDTLPDELRHNAARPKAQVAGQTLTWERRLAPGEEWEIELDVTLAKDYEGSTIRNEASVTFNGDDTLYSRDEDTTPVLRPQPVPPVVTKTASVRQVQPGESYTYTITVANYSQLAADAVVTDALPTGLTYKGSEPQADVDGQTLRWRKAMEPGEVWTIDVTVMLDEGFGGAEIRNTAVAQFNDDPALRGSDDEDTAVVRPLPPVVTKTTDRESVQPGESYTYTIAVKNESAVAVDAVVTDDLPEGLRYEGSSQTPVVNGQLLTWHKAMQPGEVWEIELRVVLDAGYSASEVVNTAKAVFNGDPALAGTGTAATPVHKPGGGGNGDDPATGDRGVLLWWATALAALCGLAGMVGMRVYTTRKRHRERFAWYYRKDR